MLILTILKQKISHVFTLRLKNIIYVLPKVLNALFAMVLRRHPLSRSSCRPLFSKNAEFDTTCISVLSERSRILSLVSGFSAVVGTSRNLLPLKSRISRLYSPAKVPSGNVAKLFEDKSSSRNNEQHPPSFFITKLSSFIASI